MRKHRHGGVSRTGTVLAASTFFVAGAAWGQGDSLLRGPTVTEHDAPGVPTRYVEGTPSRDQRSVSLQVYLATIRGMNEEGSPRAVRMSDEQVGLVREELRAFADGIRGFDERHGAEMRELLGSLPRNERRAFAELYELQRMSRLVDRAARSDRLGDLAWSGEARDGRRDGARGGSEDGFRIRIEGGGDARPPMEEMMRAEDASASARLRELQAAAPSVKNLQIRVWELLNDSQRDHMEAALERRRAEQEARRAEAQAKRQAAQRAAAREGAGVSDAPSDRAALDLGDATIDRVLRALEGGEIPQRLWERLPERMRQRLLGLPEEERAAALGRALESRRREKPSPGL